ncbi:putative gag-pol polyprotein [Tanacetum coccineum]
MKVQLVPGAFVKHYNKFLGAEGVSNPLDAHDLFIRVLDNSKADCMVRDVTDDKIKSVVFSMGDDRVSGPDGFTAAFFKKVGDVVGGDITCAIRDFLSNELMRNYHRRRSPPRCAFKVDIQKAYDTVDWKFLETILVGFGFHLKMVQWIMVCVSGASYCISVNGNVHGYVSSVSVIMDALEEFKQVSGLVPSIPKSTAYFCNVPNAIKASILNSMPFAEGVLPVRYLGVPLISSRLLFRDCKILVEKLESRVNDWRNKFLSLAGRLQLIRSVLSSMHIYWASVFILPSRIVHDLEQLMRGFLWCQGEMKKGKAKVAWDSVCMPKHEGGLGIRRIEDFNIALMATHIWSIFTHRESLWVKWVHTYKLKGRSFWDVPCRGDASWGWRKLLQIRSTIRPFIWHKINNGKSTSVWFDRWTDVCPLKDLLSNRDIVRSGFSLENSVSNLISDGVWRWPLDWLSRFPFLAQLHVPVLLDDMDDVILWRDRDGQKLKTQDRLRQWDVGPSIDLNLLKCPLCDLVPDSHDHLFFECSFSSQVWSKVRVLCGMDAIPPHLSDVVAFIVPLSKGKTVVSIISRIVVAATSYYIWLERNGRLFKKKTSTPGQIVDVIFSTVRLKLVTFKFKKMSTKSRLLLDQWKIPSYCIVHDGSTRQPYLDLYCSYRVAAGLRDARLIISDGLSEIASKIGNPMMLDSFTSTMCNESWGRNSFASAMIEISSDIELKESLVVAIPNLEGEEYTHETDVKKEKRSVHSSGGKNNGISVVYEAAGTQIDESDDDDVENVYDKTERRQLWESLQMHNHCIHDNPWVLMGDFNASLNLKDTFCSSSAINISMRDFKECVQNIGVMDVNSTGLHYTWNQKRIAETGI